MQTISLIAAMDKNRVIGKDGGGLLWHLPADLRRFKTVTLGKPVIMGRKTLESIGRPLSGRTNIGITRNTSYEASGCIVVHSPNEALKAAGDAEEVMIIGGAEVFAHFLPRAKRMYITLIDGAFSGNVYFPEWNSEEWRETWRETHGSNDKNPFGYTFLTLEKV